MFLFLLLLQCNGDVIRNSNGLTNNLYSINAIDDLQFDGNEKVSLVGAKNQLRCNDCWHRVYRNLSHVFGIDRRFESTSEWLFLTNLCGNCYSLCGICWSLKFWPALKFSMWLATATQLQQKPVFISNKFQHRNELKKILRMRPT